MSTRPAWISASSCCRAGRSIVAPESPPSSYPSDRHTQPSCRWLLMKASQASRCACSELNSCSSPSSDDLRPDQEEVTPGPHAHETAGSQGGAATASARVDPGNRELAWPNRRRIFRLPRRADQQRGDRRIPLPRHRSLVPATVPAQPEGTAGVVADGEAG